MEKFIPLQPFKTGGVKLANDSKEGNSIVYGISNNAFFVHYSSIW